MKIVVEPESLRATARALRVAARDLDFLGQQITGLAIPEMPGGQQARFQAQLRQIGATVRHSGNDLPRAADDLDRRALQAVLANIGGNQPFMPFFDGKRFFRNASDLFNTKRWSPHDRFHPGEGSKLLRSWGAKDYRYTKQELKDFKENGPRTQKGAAGVYVKKEGSAALGQIGGRGPVQAAVGEAYGSARGGIDLRRGQVAGEVAGGVNLVRGSVQFRGRHGGVEAGGSVGVNAKARAGVGFTPKNFGAEAGGSAFAGGEAHTSGNVKVSGVDTKASAGVSYGIGAEGEAEAKIVNGKIKVKARIGATLGLGANVGVDVEVDPVKTGKDIAHGAKSVIDHIF